MHGTFRFWTLLNHAGVNSVCLGRAFLRNDEEIYGDGQDKFKGTCEIGGFLVPPELFLYGYRLFFLTRG